MTDHRTPALPHSHTACRAVAVRRRRAIHNLFAVLLISAVCLTGRESVGGGEKSGPSTLIIIPARYEIVKLSFDIAALRPVSLMAYNSEADPASPIMHVWNSEMQEWIATSIEDYFSGSIFEVAPQRIILVGRDEDLPFCLIEAPLWCSDVKHIPTLNIVTLVNSLNESLEFTRYEWKLLAERHGLKLEDLSTRRKKKGIPFRQFFHRLLRRLFPPKEVAEVKEPVPPVPREVDLPARRSPAKRGEVGSADLSAVALAKSEALAEAEGPPEALAAEEEAPPSIAEPEEPIPARVKEPSPEPEIVPEPRVLAKLDKWVELTERAERVERLERAEVPEPEARPEPAERPRPEPAERPRPEPAERARPEPAERARPEPAPLTLKAAIERAIANSKQVAVFRTAVDVAAQQKLVAVDLVDPELRLTYSEDSTLTECRTPRGRMIETRTEEGETYRVGLRVFPPNPWTRSALVSVGISNLYAAMADFRNAEWFVSIEVQRLFTQTHYLEEDIKILDELVDAHGLTLRIVKQRTEQGQAAIQDLMVASRRYLRALSDRNLTARRLDEARSLLATLVAVPAERLEIVIDDDDFAVFDLTSINTDRLQQTALRNRTDLHALNWRAKAAKAAYQEARSARIPWLNFVEMSYADQEALENMPGRVDEADVDEWRVDAAINIPVFAGMNHTPDLRLAEYQQARIWEAEATKRICREVRDALSALRNIEKTHARYESGAGSVIRAMQKVLDDLGDEPELPPDEVARIREQILESQRLKLQSGFEYHLAVIRLQEVLGAASATAEP